MHQHNYVAQNYNIQTDFHNWMDEDECGVNAKNPHDDNHLNEVSSVYNLLYPVIDSSEMKSVTVHATNLQHLIKSTIESCTQVSMVDLVRYCKLVACTVTDFISLLSVNMYKRCILPGECSHVVIMIITSLHE